MLPINKIYNMDCLEGMKLIDDNSIDSIVTDPPYELGFMGKKWDSTGIAYNVELWQEALRGLKPGGHLLAFGGTRTYHRMVCAIEDAGFEIRDQMQWIYGSGFPKSHDISKAIDKKLGAEREVVGSRIKKAGDMRSNSYGKGGNYDDIEINITSPSSDEAKQWDGWGTALKPANEPIVVARKPISEKTVADNVLKWGTGGLNIDGCRIPTEDNLDGGAYAKNGTPRDDGWGMQRGGAGEYVQPTGRFPANVILDEEAGKLLDEQSGISKRVDNRVNCETGNSAIWGKENKVISKRPQDLGGGASRFFYCAKASKKERGEGNNHPTVKPIILMEYLIKLVTPKNGITLDIFEGSGTTAIACINTNRKYIGFELDTGYFNIATERIENHKQQLTLF